MVRPLLRRRGRVAEPRARSSVTRLVTSCREQHAIARSINRYLYIYVMNAIACRSRHGTAQRARPVACLQSVRFRKSTFPGTACLIQALTFYWHIMLYLNVHLICSLNMWAGDPKERSPGCAWALWPHAIHAKIMLPWSRMPQLPLHHFNSATEEYCIQHELEMKQRHRVEFRRINYMSI